MLVPQQGKRAPGASDADYFQSLGYKLVDDPKKEGAQRLESADEFVARMTAMVLLFASIVQTESAGNPLPLSFGWTWMARCLNSMPPNRCGHTTEQGHARLSVLASVHGFSCRTPKLCMHV